MVHLSRKRKFQSLWISGLKFGAHNKTEIYKGRKHPIEIASTNIKRYYNEWWALICTIEIERKRQKKNERTESSGEVEF